MQEASMTKIQLSRSQNKTYLQLPEEFGETAEVELFKLKDGYYLLSLPISANTAQKEHTNIETAEKQHKHKNNEQLDEEEISTLRRLVSIRFVDRVPNHVETILNQREKEILKVLEKKNLVNVFKGSKYKDGVYNISDKAYSLITQSAQKSNTSQEPNQPPVTVQITNNNVQMPTQNSIALLKSQGFVVVTDRNEAFNISQSVSADMKRGDVVGIKGFDGKFYAVTKDYLIKGRDLIIKCLKEDMAVSAIANETKLDQNGATAILRLMSEAGDIIEKRKGVFSLV